MGRPISCSCQCADLICSEYGWATRGSANGNFYAGAVPSSLDYYSGTSYSWSIDGVNPTNYAQPYIGRSTVAPIVGSGDGTWSTTQWGGGGPSDQTGSVWTYTNNTGDTVTPDTLRLNDFVPPFSTGSQPEYLTLDQFLLSIRGTGVSLDNAVFKLINGGTTQVLGTVTTDSGVSVTPDRTTGMPHSVPNVSFLFRRSDNTLTDNIGIRDFYFNNTPTVDVQVSVADGGTVTLGSVYATRDTWCRCNLTRTVNTEGQVQVTNQQMLDLGWVDVSPGGLDPDAYIGPVNNITQGASSGLARPEDVFHVVGGSPASDIPMVVQGNIGQGGFSAYTRQLYDEFNLIGDTVPRDILRFPWVTMYGGLFPTSNLYGQIYYQAVYQADNIDLNPCNNTINMSLLGAFKRDTGSGSPPSSTSDSDASSYFPSDIVVVY